ISRFSIMDVVKTVSILSRNHAKVFLRFYSNKQSEHLLKYRPSSLPPSDEDLERLRNFISKRRKLFVLSGAGLSTESGIPDYRSKDVGLYARTNHKPMQHQDFVKSADKRKIYWARSYLGWAKYDAWKPNAAHVKLAAMEKDGRVEWHTTQNVDGLMVKAGAEQLTELHGQMRRVVCMRCNGLLDRNVMQKDMDALNKHWSAEVLGYGPDADVFIREEDVIDFNVPACRKCGGDLKPNVTFFGDNVPRSKVTFVRSIVDKCDGVLVVGSSLHVWSGYRFITQAHELGVPIAIVNVGETRADKFAAVKIDALCTDVFRAIE
uniref:NAD-dependent protein lipoamidase sirtuin-4, mitochondrial n=2 Tax=Ciona intestinalis TaxID=7719 RepID=F6TVS6_CIOIN